MNQDTPPDPRPILITGAAGFIGSSLTDLLLTRGQTVVGLDNFCDFYSPSVKHANLESAMAHPRFELIEADIRDRPAVLEAFARYRPASLVHLAAMAGVRPSIEQPAYYSAVNIDGTVNLLDGAVAHGVERFLFASSSSVYGNNPKTPFSETDPVDNPISPYAATKKAGELLCHTYHHLYHLPIFCLRFFTVFGPRQRPDLAIAKFLHLVGAGQPIPVFGDGSSSRDYTYIDDILAGITAALERCGNPTVLTSRDREGAETSPASTPTYRIYNLGGSHPVSLTELIATIERITGRQAQIDRRPLQPGDVERTWADLSRSQGELGYHPATTLADGIARQWAWVNRKATI